MNQISLDWDTVKRSYPMRPLTGGLKSFMDSLGPGNTPCCVQMSHALNAAGSVIGLRSNRRRTSTIRTSLGTFQYLLAVDEIKWFLEDNYGMCDEISTNDNGSRRTIRQMQDVLDGRTGILVFSNLRYGAHTELWDEDHMHQRDISQNIFHEPKVYFWDVMITATA
ncbi:MAG: T6SS effector amidase Tae4 family protein [Bryobacteraceae bacterium]